MTPKIILLIGGSGQLGTSLREVFADVRVIAPKHSEMPIEAPEAWSSVDATIQQGVDLVINCSAYHNVGECEHNIDHAFAVNAVAVGRVAKACARQGIPFVHASTDYVFRGTEREIAQDYDAYDSCAPVNSYGISKFAGERLALNANPKTTIIRTAGLYGPSGISGKGPHFLERVLRAAELGEVFRAVDDVFFSPSYAPYVARAMREIIEAGEYGIHHVAGTGCISWHEFAEQAHLEYCAMTGKPLHHLGILARINLASLNEPFKRPMRVNLVSPTPRMPPWQRGVEEYVRQRYDKRAANH